MVCSSALSVGFFLLLRPMEMLSENVSVYVAALLKGQLGITGRVPLTMWTDGAKCGRRAKFWTPLLVAFLQLLLVTPSYLLCSLSYSWILGDFWSILALLSTPFMP